jgi:hypothetical protein
MGNATHPHPSRAFRYRLQDTTGDDLGPIEHPAPNVEPGDVVVLADGQGRLRATATLIENLRGVHGDEACVRSK